MGGRLARVSCEPYTPCSAPSGSTVVRRSRRAVALDSLATRLRRLLRLPFVASECMELMRAVTPGSEAASNASARSCCTSRLSEPALGWEVLTLTLMAKGEAALGPPGVTDEAPRDACGKAAWAATCGAVVRAAEKRHE